MRELREEVVRLRIPAEPTRTLARPLSVLRCWQGFLFALGTHQQGRGVQIPDGSWSASGEALGASAAVSWVGGGFLLPLAVLLASCWAS